MEDVTEECVGLLVLFNGMADDDEEEGEVLGDGDDEDGMCCNDLHCLIMEVRIGDAVVLSLPPSSLSLLFSCNDILLSKLFIASDMI